MYSHRIHKYKHHSGVVHVSRGLTLYVTLSIACLIIIQQAIFFAAVDTSALSSLFSRQPSGQLSAVINLDSSEEIINDFMSSSVDLTLYATPNGQDTTITILASDLGITLDKEMLRNKASRYDPSSLIPFAGLATDRTVPFSEYISVDQTKLTAYAQALHQQYYIAPTNSIPSYAVGSQSISLSPSIAGYSYGVAQIEKVLYDAIAMRIDSVGLSAKSIQPTITDAFLQTQTATLNNIRNSRVTFSDDNHSYVLAGNNQALTAVEPTTTTGYTLNLAKLRTVLQEWISPQFTPNPIADQQDKTIDLDLLAEQYAKALRSDSEQSIKIAYTDAIPVADTAQTDSSVDLQQLVTTLGEQYGAGIAIKQLDGNALSASYDAGRSKVSASTYKLLVAYAVAQDISSGASQWSDSVYNSTIRSCMESMLVQSTNPCASNWVKNEYGYDYMNDIAASLQLTSTCFGCGDYTLSSTSDQIRLMELFYRSTGVNQDIADTILDMLDRGRGQSGIPYGQPYKIYNKIGWVPGYFNDTAIIELPNTTVALSIYTDSNSWTQIRDITSQVIDQLTTVSTP